MILKNREWLFETIMSKQSMLCVGLDSDMNRLPDCVLGHEDPIFEFNKQIINATADSCVAYKINTAFYESMGVSGWKALQKTIEYIPSSHLVIADAKRGDIGNTSAQYAKTFFETFECDGVTVSPYMGHDSLSPFLKYENKWTIILALTSNAGSEDFQNQQLAGGNKVYDQVLKTSQEWGTQDQLMYVVGATKPEAFTDIRKIIPDHFLLIPGIGAQGGDLEKVVANAKNDKVGLLFNSSRSIIFASGENDFAEAAGAEAKKMHSQMKPLLN